ncbi:VOC family protein [Ileibacterium valens]|uniref:Glyoxalase n=1 Tax=Ileibacterium valens TaxID=1862668 RepID=A0A1U7NDU9_9FIRM|nr:VOC family protein [Ileibacterium valens]OLU37491.1 glyoxalase [Erysipelotrichaceae bacterium NYU-BL-E8]OLU37575.1 glyoxalase [Ileibacterium valens]OLU43059.1 glyoxalase [Erysipelotrichaceae bacterium NYU-BL-F16]
MKIEHAALYVEDLEKAKNFFTTMLKGVSNEIYHNPKTGFSSYFIEFDEGARLEIMNKPGLLKANFETPRTGYAHLAFSVGNKEEVDRLTKELQEAGYETMNGPRMTGDGYYESVIASVEGHPIEITI